MERKQFFVIFVLIRSWGCSHKHNSKSLPRLHRIPEWHGQYLSENLRFRIRQESAHAPVLDDTVRLAVLRCTGATQESSLRRKRRYVVCRCHHILPLGWLLGELQLVPRLEKKIPWLGSTFTYRRTNTPLWSSAISPWRSEWVVQNHPSWEIQLRQEILDRDQWGSHCTHHAPIGRGPLHALHFDAGASFGLD